MSNPNRVPSPWNKEPKLGAFFGVTSGEQDTLPVWERIKRFASWAGGAALTVPSEAPVHMREHFPNHQPDQNLAA